jgi:Ca2+-binding EF-hand superfamily protein
MYVRRALDADGNGCVDFLEFIMVNNLVCARTPKEKLSWAFKVSVASMRNPVL